MTLWVNGALSCVSEPRYGAQEGVPGNEKGHLVQVSGCTPQESAGLGLKKGGMLAVRGDYFVGSQGDRLLCSGGAHLNVMSCMCVACTAAPPGLGWAGAVSLRGD